MEEVFLQLVRLGIEHQGYILSKDIDWDEIEALAARQGLLAVIVDGIERLPETKRPPKELLLQWIGETLQGYEYRYEQYGIAISELASFYNAHDFKMMVLKGYACSLDWPKPEHRPCGDIDIWQFGRQNEADMVLAKEKGVNIDRSHHHHTVFFWRDFMVENHYDFVNVLQNKTNAQIERILKNLGMDDSFTIELYGEKFYMPSPNLHALFLLKHTMLHFVLGEFSLRQLLDWAFFVEKHGKEINWEWLLGVLKEYGMIPAYNLFNAICVENLGFEANIFHGIVFNPSIKDSILKEIMHPEYNSYDPDGFFASLIYKLRRWKASGWKYKLCYNESRWSSFWYGVWSHLLKSGSI